MGVQGIHCSTCGICENKIYIGAMGDMVVQGIQ